MDNCHEQYQGKGDEVKEHYWVWSMSTATPCHPLALRLGQTLYEQEQRRLDLYYKNLFISCCDPIIYVVKQ